MHPAPAPPLAPTNYSHQLNITWEAVACDKQPANGRQEFNATKTMFSLALLERVNPFEGIQVAKNLSCKTSVKTTTMLQKYCSILKDKCFFQSPQERRRPS